MQSKLIGILRRMAPSLRASEALLYAAIVAMALVPVIWFALTHSIPIYVNAWDEETYLTVPAARAVKDMVGYYSSALVEYLIVQHGWTGALVNTVSDIVLIPATLACAAFAISRYLAVSMGRALMLAVVVTHAGVLLNYANPLIPALLPTRGYALITVGWETYPALYRTPAPQWSFTLIAAFLALSTLPRRPVIRLVIAAAPIPLLYVFPLVGLVFMLCLCAGWVLLGWAIGDRRLRHANAIIIALGLVTWAGLGLTLLIFKPVFLPLLGPASSGLQTVVMGHAPLISVHALAGIVLLGLVWRRGGAPIKMAGLAPRTMMLMFVLAMLGLTNPQIISGYQPVPKNMIDYAVSILFGATLAIALTTYAQTRIAALARCIMACVIAVLVLKINVVALLAQQGLATWRGPLAEVDLARIQEQPCTVVVLETDFAAKLSYGLALNVHMPFAYQNIFPLPGGDAEFHGQLLDRISPTLNRAERDSLQVTLERIQAAPARSAAVPTDRCSTSDLAGRPVYVIRAGQPTVEVAAP